MSAAMMFASSALLAMSILLAGCGPVRLVASADIPEPLVAKIPVAVALFMPQEFTQYVHIEERWGTDWNIEIGKAQTDAVSELMNAMFDRVIPVDSLNAGAQLGSGISAILEPSVEEYAFVTPRDAGSPFYAVSIKYRVNVYLPDGKLADSWGFTGYGTAPAGGLSNTEPLENATALAMRDAGAKLAVEFREQAIVRGLLPAPPSADAPVTPASATPPGTEVPSPQETESDAEEPGSPPLIEDPEPETPSAAPSEEGTSSEEDEPAEEESPQELDVEAFASRWKEIADRDRGRDRG